MRALLQGPRALSRYVDDLMRRDHGSTESIMLLPGRLVLVMLLLLWARGRIAYPVIRFRRHQVRWLIRVHPWRETGWRHFLTRQA